MITEAFLACSPYKDDFSPLQGKLVRKPVQPHKLLLWPPKALLVDRYENFCKENEKRRLRNEAYPEFCILCCKRWKTIVGKENHSCKDLNTKATQRNINHYETPKKIVNQLPNLNSLDLNCNNTDPGEIDNELSFFWDDEDMDM